MPSPDTGLMASSEVEPPLILHFAQPHPEYLKQSALVRLVGHDGIWQVTKIVPGEWVTTITMWRADVELHVLANFAQS